MQPIPRRILLGALILIGLTWTWMSRVEPGSSVPGDLEVPQAGFLAPGFTLETLEGDPVELPALRGNPVIINFWATWCPPCRAEMPALQEIHSVYQGKVIVLAINATSQDTLEKVKSFLEENELSLPVLLDGTGETQRLYKVTSLPTTFFVDANGIIQEVAIGGPLTEAGLRTRVEELLEIRP